MNMALCTIGGLALTGAGDVDLARTIFEYLRHLGALRNAEEDWLRGPHSVRKDLTYDIIHKPTALYLGSYTHHQILTSRLTLQSNMIQNEGGNRVISWHGYKLPIYILQEKDHFAITVI